MRGFVRIPEWGWTFTRASEPKSALKTCGTQSADHITPIEPAHKEGPIGSCEAPAGVRVSGGRDGRGAGNKGGCSTASDSSSD